MIKNSVLKLLHLTNGKPLKTPFSGMGHIFGLHRIMSSKYKSFPHFNGILELSSEKLEKTIIYLKDKYEFISINDLTNYKKEEHKKPFIIFTFDDAYFDVYTNAYPILKKHQIPFTLYVTSNMHNTNFFLWWFALEEMIMGQNSINFYFKKEYTYKCTTFEDKSVAFNTIRDFILQSDKNEFEEKLKNIFSAYKGNKDFTNLLMTWDQIIELSHDPLVTIGGHTLSHYNLAFLNETDFKSEILNSKIVIESKINKPVEHLAYPFGSKNEINRTNENIVSECGYKTAVTTMSGTIFNLNNKYFLPRILLFNNFTEFSLNIRLSGIYQYLTKQ